MKTHYRIVLLSLLALLIGMQEGWGQLPLPEGNKYNNINETAEIKHRLPKWKAIVSETTTIDPQDAHEYVDTIYMRKGTSITLTLPDRLVSNGAYFSNARTYQRWYNYRTKGLFEIKYKSTGAFEGDLLNPNSPVANPVKPYRYQNGYVGSWRTGLGGNFSNVADQMTFFYPSDGQTSFYDCSNLENDNSYYVVACDVSNYKDYYTKSGYIIEPSLTHRVLFYIYGVNDIWSTNPCAYEQALKSAEFQGGSLEGKYWENYEITFPAIRFSDQTKDVIALSKDANAFAIPMDESGSDDTDVLSVTLAENSAGISLVNNQVSGANRIIHFAYPNDNGGKGPFHVADGKTATILVTKAVGGKIYNLARYKLTFKDGFQQLTQSQVKQLDENAVAESSWWKNYGYRTPQYLEQNYRKIAQLDFEEDKYNPTNGGYSSQPLEPKECSYGFFDGGTSYFNGKAQPEWGSYGITNKSVNETKSDILLPDSRAHLFVDASDRPGLIAKLSFTEQLCSGSELYFSAWVKSATGGWSGNVKIADPCMLFTLLGVTNEGEEVPIYRYSTGSITKTVNLATGRPEPGLSNNEWYQVYFSFVNHNESYPQYILQVENNSSSTAGGDMYLDDIRVYVAAPQVNAIQHKALCNQTKNPHVQVLFDWEQISALTAGGAENNKLSFAVIASKDSSKFKTGGSASETDLVNLWNGKSTNDADVVTSFTLSYNSTFESNLLYELTAEGSDDYAAKTGGAFRRYINGKKYLTVDLYGPFEPNVDYTILAEKTTSFNINNFKGSSYYKESSCATYKEFRLTAKNDIVVNGTVLDPTNVCAGQTYNFQIQMKAQNPETGALHVINQTIYHDWFFGTETDFNKGNSSYGNNTLNNALTKFRQYYPNTDNDLTGVEPMGEFTDDMRNLINAHMNPTPESGLGKLVLYQSSLNIQLPDGALNLVIKPIQQTLTGIQDEWVCWEYKTLSMTFGSERSAPSLKVGFADVTYPPYYNQALRIGLNQLQATDPSKLLRIPIHKISNATGGLTTVTDLDDLFLIETDDPEWQAHLDAHQGDEYEFAVGKVHKFEHTDGAGQNYVDIYFNNNDHTINGTSYVLEPHEGYHYYFGFHFTSQNNSGTCNGRAVILLKIVPEYQVWTGNATSDWTNRNNWQRATAEQLHGMTGYTDYSAPYTHKGYAPMSFTKIILREGAKMTLQKPVYKDETHKILQLSASASEGADRDIEYDLVVKKAESSSGDVAYDCEPYSINRVSEVHFEPNAEMLHAELLKHEKAWVDYRVTKGRWQLLSSPFKDNGMFAGDWYTGTSGSESAAYFTKINFDGHSRTNPAVYQRSWGGTAHLITGERNTTDSYQKVSFDNGWSALCNSMNMAYNPGFGFSLKVMGTMDNYTFRFPKADTKYFYYDKDGLQSGMNSDISRAGDQKLAVSTLTGEATELTITPSFGSSDFYMVGNPFMAHLDMHKFFAENTGLEQRYWMLSNQRVISSGEGRQEWVATAVTEGTPVPTIGPMQAFFVKKGSSTPGTIKFTTAMQTLAESSTGSTNSANALTRTKAQATANASVKEPHTLQIQSIGESRLMVLATEPIRFLGVYTLDGKQLWVEIPQTTERILSLPTGLYVIRAVTDSQTQSTKIIVR